MISPDLYRSLPCPTYPEIRLALAGTRAVGRRLDRVRPDAIHISTEGPLGWAARRWCSTAARAFTTAYHTQFPDYLARRTGLAGVAVLALYPPLPRTLGRDHGGDRDDPRAAARAWASSQLRHWGRGVDLACFGPELAPPDLFFELPRPIQLYVGRVAVEKNIEAFLQQPASRLEGRGRRRARAGAAPGGVPRGAFPRQADRPRAGRVLRRRRRVRVPEPDRHASAW